MKFHVFSDLHFDGRSGGWIPALSPGADAVLCAGDVCEGFEPAFRFLRNFIPEPTPIITVAGNHTFYNRAFGYEWEAGREAADRYGVTLLENEAFVLGGVRILGCTLWTDYRLFGEGSRDQIKEIAALQMNDHRLIRWRRDPPITFMPSHAAVLHAMSRSWLARALAEPFDGPTVVLTHHAPHRGSVAPRYSADPVTAAFVSDLSGLIEEHQPAAWVHGHTHSSFDYVVGRTRILCNPHGYGRENVVGFAPNLVLSAD